MDMIMPQELEVWYLLPAIRRELAKEMLKLGMKQVRVAKKLGMTRAAISQYLRYKRAQKIHFDKCTLLEIKKSARCLSQGESSCLIHHMQNISKIAKQNKLLCNLHRHCNKLPTACCEVCLK